MKKKRKKHRIKGVVRILTTGGAVGVTSAKHPCRPKLAVRPSNHAWGAVFVPLDAVGQLLVADSDVVVVIVRAFGQLLGAG